jgi:DNA invertase Pin-like site-specific DNA recombinase
MAIAIYARVSTTDQDCSMQLRELRDYAQRQGWHIFHEYVDHGVSGAKATRPALTRLMTDARLKRFDAVVVWKLDRFGRSLPQLIENVQQLDSFGVRFIAMTQGIDTDQRNPAGRLLLHILASLAEFERDTIIERVRAGIATAQARGTHCGRPQRVFRRDEAVRLRDSGMSWRAVAEKLGVPVMTVVDGVRKGSLETGSRSTEK